MQLDPRTAVVASHLTRRPVGGLTAEIFVDADGEKAIAFCGGRWGSTSLSLNSAITSVQRLLSHWEGYAAANGVDPVFTVGSAYWYDGNGNKANARAVLVTNKGARGAVWFRRVYADGRVGTAYSHTPRYRGTST